jgi:hypothetical protein
MNRVEDVRRDQNKAEADQEGEDTDAHRDQLLQVDQAGVRPAAEPGQPGPDALVEDDGEMAPVQREQREQVEGADEDVQRDDDQQQGRDRELPAAAGLDDLAGVIGGADDASSGPF